MILNILKAVNNLIICRFYEHLGFKVFKCSEYDEQGNHYPILYMKK